MTVYVDDMRLLARVGRYRARWSHLFTDQPDLTELHALAARIGLRRAWFQDHPRHPHYDVTDRQAGRGDRGRSRADHLAPGRRTVRPDGHPPPHTHQQRGAPVMTKFVMHVEASRSWWRGTSTTLCGLTFRVQRATYWGATTCTECRALEKAARKRRRDGGRR